MNTILRNTTVPESAQAPPSGIRSFEHLVRTLAESPATRDRRLSDGEFETSYRDLPGLFEHYDALVEATGLDRRQPLPLECSQSVGGAVGMLYFLARGYDVLLLPQGAEHSKESSLPRYVPEFSPFIASTFRAEPGTEAALVLERNSDYEAASLVESFAEAERQSADLYLRTSGSTSSPKMARMTHHKWLQNGVGCVKRWGLVPEDRLAIPVPIFHSYGFGAAFLPGLLAGACLDIQGSFNILRYMSNEKRFEPNVAFLTPALCDMFLKIRSTPRPYKLSVTAGDKVKEETVVGFEPLFGPLLDLYGSAEMGAVASPGPDVPLEARRGTAGPPLPGIELRLEDLDGDNSAPDAGLLACRQASGFDGYLYQEGDGPNAWRFDARNNDTWYRTGDIARLREDGHLRVLGRAGLSVKRDGLLVVFGEVEAALTALDAIDRAVVFSQGESRRGRRLIAACESREALTEKEIHRLLSERLPAYAVPDDIVLVDALPLLPNGKVDRRAVPGLICTV